MSGLPRFMQATTTSRARGRDHPSVLGVKNQQPADGMSGPSKDELADGAAPFVFNSHTADAPASKPRRMGKPTAQAKGRSVHHKAPLPRKDPAWQVSSCGADGKRRRMRTPPGLYAPPAAPTAAAASAAQSGAEGARASALSEINSLRDLLLDKHVSLSAAELEEVTAHVSRARTCVEQRDSLTLTRAARAAIVGTSEAHPSSSEAQPAAPPNPFSAPMAPLPPPIVVDDRDVTLGANDASAAAKLDEDVAFADGGTYDMSGDEAEAEDDHRFTIASEAGEDRPSVPSDRVAWTPSGMRQNGGGLFHFL